jgi:multidrug efflux pump subunit AcrB
MGAPASIFILSVAVVTLVATIWLVCPGAQRIVAQQDTGMILGITDSSQTISFGPWCTPARGSGDCSPKDPDVVILVLLCRRRLGESYHETPDRLYIGLKRTGQRKASAGKSSNVSARRLGSCRVSRSFMQAVQDVKVDSGSAAPSTNIPCQDADEGPKLTQWATKLLNGLRGFVGGGGGGGEGGETRNTLTDVASDTSHPAGAGPNVVVDRARRASRLKTFYPSYR